MLKGSVNYWIHNKNVKENDYQIVNDLIVIFYWN
jgi:SPX domain protein involved in polyphosphate accumulation